MAQHQMQQMTVEALEQWAEELAAFIQAWDRPSSRWHRDVDTGGLVLDAAEQKLRQAREELGFRRAAAWEVNV